jgi:aminoglycoside 6'-N-acetyltransferase
VQDYRRHRDPDAIAGDYLLGAPELVGRGLGTRSLWSWVRHVRRRHLGCPRVFAAPEHRNTASLRALAKVGFVAGARFEETQDDGTVETLVGCTLDLAAVVCD